MWHAWRCVNYAVSALCAEKCACDRWVCVHECQCSRVCVVHPNTCEHTHTPLPHFETHAPHLCTHHTPDAHPHNSRTHITSHNNTKQAITQTTHATTNKGSWQIHKKPIKRRHNRPWKNTHIRVTKQSNTNQHTTLSRLQSVENTCWKTNSSTHVVIKKVDHTDRKDNLGKKKKGNIWRNQSRSTNEFLYMPGNHWTSKNKLLLSVKPTCVCGSDECVNLRVRVCGCGMVRLRCIVRVCVQQKTKTVAHRH